MNKIEQRVQRYKEDVALITQVLTEGNDIMRDLDNLNLFLKQKKQLEEKFLADIIDLSKTPYGSF
jgi:cell shape-determining protein MreC